MLKVLTFTSLYPNTEMPQLGVFVENRLRNLLQDTDIESHVFVPVPWFPFSQYCGEKYAKYARISKKDNRHGIKVTYSRYFHLPKIGMNMQAISMAISSYFQIKRIIREGYNFELIDAHYVYPDGVAAVLLAKMLNKPVVITARGSDLNVYRKYFVPRILIKWATKKANALITVCQALKDVLADMSVAGEKVTVLRNGVDLDLFSPLEDREKARRKLGLEGKTLLMVGRLVGLKGHKLAIQALALIKNTSLLIIGEGEEKERLEQLVEELSLGERVRFIGAVAHSELAAYYSAADALLLASSSEGWANVILEAMACGTPTVATNVGGTSEIICSPEAGVLVKDRTAEGIAHAIEQLIDNYPNRQATRAYAEKFSWLETSHGQKQLFQNII